MPPSVLIRWCFESGHTYDDGVVPESVSGCELRCSPGTRVVVIDRQGEGVLDRWGRDVTVDSMAGVCGMEVGVLMALICGVMSQVWTKT
jgi:hypothetical protein